MIQCYCEIVSLFILKRTTFYLRYFSSDPFNANSKISWSFPRPTSEEIGFVFIWGGGKMNLMVFVELWIFYFGMHLSFLLGAS